MKGLKSGTHLDRLKGSVPLHLGPRVIAGEVSIDTLQRRGQSQGSQTDEYSQIAMTASRCTTADDAAAIIDRFKVYLAYCATLLDPNYFIPNRELSKIDTWARAKWARLNIAPRQVYPVEVRDGVDTDRSWADLNGGVVYTPQRGSASDTEGMWDMMRDDLDLSVLKKLMTKAERLSLPDTDSGMAFHVERCNVTSGSITSSEVFNEAVTSKPGAGGCYENVVLPLDMGSEWSGHIVVHQDKTPCGLCRESYRKWAMARQCTICVAVSDPAGYDGCRGDGIFVFSKTGNGAHLH